MKFLNLFTALYRACSNIVCYYIYELYNGSITGLEGKLTLFADETVLKYSSANPIELQNKIEKHMNTFDLIQCAKISYEY